MIDDDELAILRAVAVSVDGVPNHGIEAGRHVDITVNACAYSCCGRGWRRKDGYEQTYRGYVDNLALPAGEAQGTFMLYNPGLGSMVVVAVRFYEVELVEYDPENGRRALGTSL